MPNNVPAGYRVVTGVMPPELHRELRRFAALLDSSNIDLVNEAVEAYLPTLAKKASKLDKKAS